MEMHQVRYFLSLAEELNFSRAAAKCNVSQPAFSRAIKALEEEFGGLLFHREGRFTHLSELGQMVRPHLEHVFRASHEAKEAAKDFAGLKKMVLKLGIMTTIAPDQFVDLIAAIRARHPDIELQMIDANSQDLQTRLLEGDLEVAIYALPGNEPEERTHVVPLFREQMVIAVHPSNRLASQSAIRVRDLDGESYIHRNHCEFAGYADGILREQGVTVKPAYWSDSADWTLAMIAAGLGFGFLPRNSVNHPGVVALPVVEPEFWRQVNFVTVRGRPHSPAVGALVRETMRKKWFGNSAIAAESAAHAS
jgi:DNA-binding transcriptional LysR family regulator